MSLCWICVFAFIMVQKYINSLIVVGVVYILEGQGLLCRRSSCFLGRTRCGIVCRAVNWCRWRWHGRGNWDWGGDGDFHELEK